MERLAGQYGRTARNVVDFCEVFPPAPPTRRCMTGCGTILRQSNTGAVCGACERKHTHAQLFELEMRAKCEEGGTLPMCIKGCGRLRHYGACQGTNHRVARQEGAKRG